MLVSTKELFKKCYSKYGIVAVNVWGMEMIHGLFSAAQKANAPFIIQTTPAARNYTSPLMLMTMIAAAAKLYPKTVFAIHLDHGDREQALRCIESEEYTSVMIDASQESFDESINITREVVTKAHAKGVAVEAELGWQNGRDVDLGINEKVRKYTHSEDVQEFVAQTGCDSLAVEVGTSHGAYKFSGVQGIKFDVLEEIQDKLPGFPLVLHGGSAVNKDEILRINAAGGQLGVDAKGVNDRQLVKAISYGVCKINIATDARLIWSRVNREFFKHSPAKYDPIIPGKTFMKEFEEFNLEKFDLLGATGKAKEFKI